MAEKLVRTPRGSVHYDICKSCRGIWFDAGEMDVTVFQYYESVERSSTDKVEGLSEAKRNCPRCANQVLEKVFFLTYSDILLDYCRTCHGFWLDAGEFKRINEDLRELKAMHDGAGEVEPLEKWIIAFFHSLRYCHPARPPYLYH